MTIHTSLGPPQVDGATRVYGYESRAARDSDDESVRRDPALAECRSPDAIIDVDPDNGRRYYPVTGSDRACRATYRAWARATD